MVKAHGRKHQAYDVMKLFSTVTPQQWNNWLTDCYKNNDVQSLERVFYGLQAGMTDCAKKKLNTSEIDLTFIRWQRSIEITMKRIFRKLNPNPLDNPSNVGKYGSDVLDEKRKRDAQLEEYFRKMRF